MSLHQCPGPLCTAGVQPDRLSCRDHWYQVSAATRRRVWRTWDNGAGAGSAEHIEAITAAIKEMRPL